MRWRRGGASPPALCFKRLPIVADADAAYTQSAGWFLHPLDSGEEDDDWAGISHGVYLGAAGMLWGLDFMRRVGAAATGRVVRGR